MCSLIWKLPSWRGEDGGTGTRFTASSIAASGAVLVSAFGVPVGSCGGGEEKEGEGEGGGEGKMHCGMKCVWKNMWKEEEEGDGIFIAVLSR